MDNYTIYPKQLRKQIIPVEKNRCFFLMPFSKEFNIIYGTIKLALNDAEYICNRADEILGSTPIITKILTEIMKSQYIIVDITNSNPNVFYELGISHSIKDARNVLLLKQKNYKVPFDISHLTYTEYDPNNLKYLTSIILSFLENSREKNSFYDALCRNGIINYIDENNNENIEMIIQALSDKTILCITETLNNEFTGTAEQTISTIQELNSYVQRMINDEDDKRNILIIDIFYSFIANSNSSSFIKGIVEHLLADYYTCLNISPKTELELKTRLALKLVKTEKYMDLALSWILNYFSRSKTATIDLNRYNVESFLMQSDSSIVNEAIISRLCDSDCYVREHMSDIIGEKRLVDAADLLYLQLSKEQNFFTAQSMIEAIGKINQPGGIEAVEEWVNNNKKEIMRTNQLFVLKHAYFAICKLDNTHEKSHIERFNKEFSEVLKDYYII